MLENKEIPKDGFSGLKENFFSDSISGFIVFLLALPLSLGIAKASDFPAVMGLITAIIGGMFVSLISGSRLTIKGPAAGLIVIVAGAVSEFGGGETGWKLALGAIFVAGIVQVLFGVFKLGKLSDFFPLSAVHGMLAAIGIIIISKQIPVLLNVDPVFTKGKGPIELIASIPYFLIHLDPQVSIIGLISLMIMIFWPKINIKSIKSIPAPLVVLIIAIPLQILMNFSTTKPAYVLVHVGNILENLKINVDFSGFSNTGVFIKYVIMFALVGTLESLLTVKAIDMVDPYKRKSNTDKDIIAIGVGNILSSVLGGLPMISEVARSSNNVGNGAKTRWANFFHGFFIFISLLLIPNIIELIPNAALAAMLITVGIKLAHPNEFISVLNVGKEQLAIFVITIIFTLFEDLLVGVCMGIVLKIVINFLNGVNLKSFFKANIEISEKEEEYLVKIKSASVFTNWLSIKNKLETIPNGMNIKIDFSESSLIDHSSMENYHHFIHDYEHLGGKVEIISLDLFKPLSKHELAARKNIFQVKMKEIL